MKNGVKPYDRYKLLVFSILLIILAFLSYFSQPDLPKVPVIDGQSTNKTTISQTIPHSDQLDPPPFPTNASLLRLNEKKNALVNKSGKMIYELDEDEVLWVPVIRSELREELPPDYSIKFGKNRLWQILSNNGEPVYIFDPETLEWTALTTELENNGSDLSRDNETYQCFGANPSRIGDIGGLVRVTNAEIPLRSSPDAVTQNYILSLEPGVVLEVIGFPVCSPYLIGANLWWKLRMQDGLEGYAAEGSAVSDLYYLQPIE